MDCSLPSSSVHGIPSQEYWSGLPFPSPGDLPDPGFEPGSPALQADALLSEPPGKLRFPTGKDYQISEVMKGSRTWGKVIKESKLEAWGDNHLTVDH